MATTRGGSASTGNSSDSSHSTAGASTRRSCQSCDRTRVLVCPGVRRARFQPQVVTALAAPPSASAPSLQLMSEGENLEVQRRSRAY